MTDRDDPPAERSSGETDPAVPEPPETDSSLSDAMRDGLSARTESGEHPFTAVRNRPMMPRALDTRSQQIAPVEPQADAPGMSEEGSPEATRDELELPDESRESENPGGEASAPEPDLSAESPASATWVDIEPIAEHDQEPTDAVPVEAEADPDEPSSLESSVHLDEPHAERRRVTGRGAIVVGARALAGIVGIGVAVVAIAGATAVPLPRFTSTPPELKVSPVAAAQQRVCPGPLLRLGNDEGQEATSATSIGRPTEEYQAAPRDAEADDLGETENTAGVAPLLLTLPPGSDSDDGVAAVAGSQTQIVKSGDLVGLASAECAEPGGDIWLVGGSTDVGRTTLITLSNPTTVIATVRMRVFGSAGAVVAPGLDGIVVPPGSQRVFSLAGFAPQLVSPVIRIESRGGLVVANLQQTTVRTLDPGGVDFVSATHAPARKLTIPGMVVSGASAISGAQSRLGYDDLQSTLRIFAPGTDTTTARVTITPARGTTLPPRSDSVAVEGAAPGATTESDGFEVDLPGGQVTEVPFPGLADGDYSVSVEAKVPVVAGVRVSTLTANGATDFAWLPAGVPLRETSLVSIASGPSPVLRLVNPTDEEHSVTISTSDGDVAVELAPGESVPTPMRAGRDATLTGASGMLATVTYLGPGQVSAFGLTSPGPASGDITVYR